MFTRKRQGWGVGLYYQFMDVEKEKDPLLITFEKMLGKIEAGMGQVGY